MLQPINIERISMPEITEFKKEYLEKRKPVVITGIADEWPASKLWSLDYLQNNYGDVKANSILLQNGQCHADVNKGVSMQHTAVKNLIQPIADGVLHNSWAITSPVDFFPETFKSDYTVPPFCANGSYLHSRIWVSPNHAVTPLHQDLPENLYVLVKGKKRITIYEPGAPVYVNSRFSKVPNMARVDPEAPDYVTYPKFKLAQAYTVDLSAGETLYIPSFWWHHLRNLEQSIAINFWWAHGWKVALSWAAAQYKKIREVGNRD